MQRRAPPPTDSDAVEEPLVNLTPLIDVVFVVLIAFMLIAPVLDIDLVELASGGATQKKEATLSPISITIRADNSIWFQGKGVSLKELEKILKAEKKTHPNQTPQLIPDKQANFGTYQAIKNLLEASGFTQMDVVLKPG
ncbi:MAG: biopolymer transporter ExbD [Chlamydiia bacterium]|nr:biopolymer transporter ExbD [Chlamydiia bacterium]